MFTAFNLKLSEEEWKILSRDNDNYKSDRLQTAKEELADNKAQIIDLLDNYLIDQDTLSAEKIEEDWFPSISTEVFISHSHKDLNRAYALAVYLRSRCGITSFIDSMVWGYANDLLRQIDNRYSKNDDDLYDYDKTQYSSAHVHILLNGALMKMMDRTECIIFLNTPNTIVFRDSNDNKYTDSPWLYSELLMTRLLRKKEKDAHRFGRKDVIQHGERFELTLRYNVKTNHLEKLELSDIEAVGERNYTNPYDALDQLYQAKGIPDSISLMDLLQ